MKKGFLFVMLILIILLNTGCWNRRELNELALVVGMSVDKADNHYLITVQVVDPSEVASQRGGGGRTPVTTYSATGKHLLEAIRRMSTIAPRKLYFSHLQMFVISESIAKDGIGKVLELLTRDSEFRKDFYIVVARHVKAREILENLTTIDKIPALKMYSSLKTSEKIWSPTIAVQLDELISALTSDGNNPVLTGITIQGNIKRGESQDNVQRIGAFGRLKYENIAVFRKDKLVGWLNEKQSKGYNYITDNVKSTALIIPCTPHNKDETVIELKHSKVTVSGEVKNGKPRIDIHIFSENNIEEVSCNIDLTKTETIRKLETEANKVIEDILYSAINKAKKLHVDIFGFGEVIHREDPKAWKSLMKNWNKDFRNLSVSIHSDFKIRGTGVVNQSYLSQEMEK